MTPEESQQLLAEMLDNIGLLTVDDPDEGYRLWHEMQDRGYTVARTQDAADGEALLRLLREALPESWTMTATRIEDAPDQWRVFAFDTVSSRFEFGDGGTIAQAADACREALPWP